MSKDAAAIISLYQQHAQAFAKARNTSLFERASLDAFRACLPDAPKVLDLGCGTGDPIAKYLSAQGAQVTGVDTSPELIDIARRTLPDARWIVGDMRGLSLGQQFHGILAWHSFFHLTPDDQRAMFPVFGAHCLGGGVLAFTSGPAAGVAMGTFQGAPLYHASLAPGEYRDLLADNGFRVQAYTPEDPLCGGATHWLALKGAR